MKVIRNEHSVENETCCRDYFRFSFLLQRLVDQRYCKGVEDSWSMQESRSIPCKIILDSRLRWSRVTYMSRSTSHQHLIPKVTIASRICHGVQEDIKGDAEQNLQTTLSTKTLPVIVEKRCLKLSFEAGYLMYIEF